ncbi:MAG: hypothetical protein HY717_16840 [Planctomycetes bacterium]|nr:hypothetical protein [Planctomycetota bacterium]
MGFPGRFESSVKVKLGLFYSKLPKVQPDPTVEKPRLGSGWFPKNKEQYLAGILSGCQLGKEEKWVKLQKSKFFLRNFSGNPEKLRIAQLRAKPAISTLSSKLLRRLRRCLDVPGPLSNSLCVFAVIIGLRAEREARSPP